MDLTKNCSQMGKQFLPLIRHPPWYSYSQYMLELLLHLVDLIRNNKCIVIKLWINNLQVDTDDHDCDLDLEEVLNLDSDQERRSYIQVTTSYTSLVYIYIYVVEWSRALDVRLSEWCCSVAMVWVQISSREEQKFDSSKI